jgi:hypothetical protein
VVLNAGGTQQAELADPWGLIGARALQQTLWFSAPRDARRPTEYTIIPTIPHCQPFIPTFTHNIPHRPP